MTLPPLDRYSPLLRALHWAMALLMLLALASGFAMLAVEAGALQNRLFDLHRSFGVSVLALLPIRLLARFLQPQPGTPPGLSPLQRKAAHSVHHLLYGLFLVQPVTGLIGSQAFGAPVIVYGLFRMPSLVDKNEALAKVFLSLHGLAVWLILALIAAHIGAALHHQFIRRDGLIRRML